MYQHIKNVFAGLCSRWKGKHNGLSGIEFDTFGRVLAVREILTQKKIDSSVAAQLANPVSCVRYFEYAYAGRVLKTEIERNNQPLSVLDISSPRLLPFWMIEKAGLFVHMINPDHVDITESKYKAQFVKNNKNLDFSDNINATSLPFDDSSFNMATSISVIEHISGSGDSKMISELKRVVHSGGKIILSFPVMPEFTNEYRENNQYNLNQCIEKNGKYFFQRFYDLESILERILSDTEVYEEDRQYWVETPVGWFEYYEKQWINNGLKHTVYDPEFMSKHFTATGNLHPENGMGICCMTLSVIKD